LVLTPDDRRRAPRCMGKFPYRPEAVGDRSPQRRTKGSTTKMISQASKVGCPIRRSMDQSSFAAPHGLSQRITSFFACACQGIHQMPLRHLIVLIANAHQYSHPSGFPNAWRTGYLLQPALLMMPSTCSTSLLDWGHAERPACKLVFKTSFSRCDPGPRGQATAISKSSEPFFRTSPSKRQQRPTRVTSFLPLPAPLSYPAG
jgi:hypothetical protein